MKSKQDTTLIAGISRVQLRDVSVFLVWLMHVSAIAGMALGYESWFISKTPLNLLVSALLLAICFPLSGVVPLVAFTVFFSCGFLAEWVGVNTGILFGDYSYGANLGVKAGGVPLLIGVNWAVLVLSSGVVAERLSASFPVRVFIGSCIMLFLDVLMEKSAPRFDFWSFHQGVVPAWNYTCWFMLAALLHTFYCLFRLKGDLMFSLHLLAANFAFFLWSYAG